MIQQIYNFMIAEPIASALFILGMGYWVLKLTGVWEWLPNKILNNPKSTTSQRK